MCVSQSFHWFSHQIHDATIMRGGLICFEDTLGSRSFQAVRGCWKLWTPSRGGGLVAPNIFLTCAMQRRRCSFPARSSRGVYACMWVCGADATAWGAASRWTVKSTKEKVESVVLKVAAGADVSWRDDAGHSDKMESTGAVVRRGVEDGIGSAAIVVRCKHGPAVHYEPCGTATD